MLSSDMNVPCFMINKDNLYTWWSFILKCLSRSDFIAIDLELSGLGPKEAIFHKDINQRYEMICEVTSTRSILSLGIACFKLNTSKGFLNNHSIQNVLSKENNYIVEQIGDCLETTDDKLFQNYTNNDNDISNDQNLYSSVSVFNFITLNTDKFVIESRAMKFLVEQGFDFNELSLKGIPFCNSNNCTDIDLTPSLQNLIKLIISLKLPLLFHNGFMDLAFLYQNFYSKLPKKLDTFLADVFEMFPSGIFDTKYIANYYLPSSFLEYSFHYSQRFNYFRHLKKLPSLIIDFSNSNEFFIDQNQLSSSSRDVKVFDLSSNILIPEIDIIKICDNYSKYGWCKEPNNCPNSHNIDLILDEEMLTKKDKKTKLLVNELKQLNGSKLQSAHDEQNKDSMPTKKMGCHHAGIDAFMTGYYFLYNHFDHSTTSNNRDDFKKFRKIKEKFKNKIFLPSHPRPLIIMKSAYAKNSNGHQSAIEMIRNFNWP